MPSLALISRVNVLTAIRDHDAQGPGPFLSALGFDAPGEELLVERGKRYDARALLSYAHSKATGTPLAPDQISLGSLKVLADLGFSVVYRSEMERAKAKPVRSSSTRARTAAAPKPATSRTKPEPVVRLCPSCFTQLSMAGTCDYCE